MTFFILFLLWVIAAFFIGMAVGRFVKTGLDETK